MLIPGIMIMMSASRISSMSIHPPKYAATAPTMVPMHTVTTAASSPSRNSDRALNISWLRMSRPSGSVPSG